MLAYRTLPFFLLAPLLLVAGCGSTDADPQQDGTAPPKADVWCGLPAPTSVPARTPTKGYDASCAASVEPSAPASQLRTSLVGRWRVCSAGGTQLPGPVLEIGGNQRFRFFQEEQGGGLTPAASHGTGRVVFVESTQVNLELDGAGGSFVGHVTLSQDGDSLDYIGFAPPIRFARIQPGPENGADNPTPVMGACSLSEGTWDITVDGESEASGSRAMALAFDKTGRFVQAQAENDPCASHVRTGSYALSGDLFELTSVSDFNTCTEIAGAGYTIAFSEDCRQATLSRVYDNCTGSAFLAKGGTMKRRP